MKVKYICENCSMTFTDEPYICLCQEYDGIMKIETYNELYGVDDEDSIEE